LRRVHRCALLSAQSSAARNGHEDIHQKAHELHGILDEA
jgi:hypothetical protein